MNHLGIDEIGDLKILIVDDEAPNVELLERLLRRAGARQLHSITDSTEAISAFETFAPDLVLLDLHMPKLDGFSVMERMRSRVPADAFLPIVVLTADITADTKRRALSSGAKDFLTKPFDAIEVLLRINNLFETRSLHVRLQNQNQELEQAVKERTSHLWETLRSLEDAHEGVRQSQGEIVSRLAIAAEYRDDDTASHVRRMSRYCALLSKLVGMDKERCERIRIAGELHDVGKIGIPDGILLKPGSLTAEEWTTMQSHSAIGYRILSGSRSELLQLAATIAHTHHEKFDGSGYPRGLSGSEIPPEGRIAAIADVFDALTSDRPYRAAYSLPEALDIMREGRGTHFDPEFLESFLRLVE